jgi:hypothetical protein
MHTAMRHELPFFSTPASVGRNVLVSGALKPTDPRLESNLAPNSVENDPSFCITRPKDEWPWRPVQTRLDRGAAFLSRMVSGGE